MRTAIVAAIVTALVCIVIQGGLLRPAYDPAEHSDRMMKAIEDTRSGRIAMANLQQGESIYNGARLSVLLEGADLLEREELLAELAAAMEAGEIDPEHLSPAAARLVLKYTAGEL